MAEGTLPSRAALAFSRLSDSEKRLVSILGVVVTVLLLAAITLLMGSQVDKRKKRVAMRNEEIAQLETLREKYDEATQAERKSQQRMKQSGGMALFTTIQRAVGEVGLTVPDLQEKRVPVKDSDVSEVTVDVTVKDLSVDKLHALLEKLEGKRGDQAVKITKLKVKTRFDNPEMLEASMTVSTWRGGDKPPDKAGDKAGDKASEKATDKTGAKTGAKTGGAP